MSVISFLFGRSGSDSRDPWVEASIYRLIEANTDPVTGRLKSDNLELPDEREVRGENSFGWAPGAMDGVFSYHAGKGDEKLAASRVAKLLESIALTGDSKSLRALYPLLKEQSALGLVDEVLKALFKADVSIRPHLERLAIRLATETKDRGPAKIGIALLGAMRLTEHQNVVLTLGKHDEFTLFAAVALRNMFDDASMALWNLAKCVDGWGRIQAVERLVPTDNPEIQSWLRTKGYRNSVMYEYLAHTAAVHGRLADALREAAVTAEELVGASEIIRALITGNGSPAEGIDAYDAAAETCRTYLAHALQHERALHHFLAAHLILDYLQQDKRATADRLKNGWSDAATESVLNLANQFVDEAFWRELVATQLRSDDTQTFHDASRAAGYLGIDTFEFHWNRLLSSPRDNGRWFWVMQRANPERIDRIVELAEREMPLDEIGTGPTLELGIGPGYQSHGCLDFVLQDLKAFPGKGWRLVETGLKSPVVRNRNMALNALEGWGTGAWPSEAKFALKRARDIEPHDAIRERMNKMLQ